MNSVKIWKWETTPYNKDGEQGLRVSTLQGIGQDCRWPDDCKRQQQVKKLPNPSQITDTWNKSS